MPIRPLACLLGLALVACGGEPVADESPAAETPQVAADAAPGSALDDLRTAVDALSERPEHTALFVRVQHVLIGVKGAPRSTFERSAEEAEALAAEIFRRAQDGEAFNQLMIESDDPGPGTYSIQKAQRKQYAQGFGDAAWRLYAGEVGVVPYDPEVSPFGYHVILRIL